MNKKPYEVRRGDGSGDENGVVQAKTYTISKADDPDDLEKCWSACNGTDSFGHEDPEIDKIRKKHGECLEKLPCCPRLILYRRRKNSAVEAKLWTMRSLDGCDDRLILASLAKAMIGLPANWLGIYMIDWAPDKPRHEDFESRFEISIEVVGNYVELEQMKKIHKQFHKHFDKGEWK